MPHITLNTPPYAVFCVRLSYDRRVFQLNERKREGKVSKGLTYMCGEREMKLRHLLIDASEQCEATWRNFFTLPPLTHSLVVLVACELIMQI